jgi:uncharacterized membrane protein
MNRENERVLVSIGIFLAVFLLLYSITWFTNPMRGHMGMMGMMGAIGFPTWPFLIAILAVIIYIVMAPGRESETTSEEKNSDELINVVERVMDKDESLIINIIKEHEGITQDSLRFKTGFSKAKISIILKELENKGIIYRERFGKTYRLYLGDWLKK